MSYSTTTSGYRIPYWGAGRSSGSSNRRAALIVDSQLSGVARLIGQNGIIQEGAYAASYVAAQSIVTLTATATNYALEAMIGSVYVAQNTTLTWSGLPDSSTIYLYVLTAETNLYQSTEVSSLANKQVVTSFNTTGLVPPGGLLLGIATTTTSAISLNVGAGIGRLWIVPLSIHRLITPIDHPAGSVDSYSLAASLSISGLQIQNSLQVLPQATATFSGLALSPGYTGTNPLELVTLGAVRQLTSGLSVTWQSVSQATQRMVPNTGYVTAYSGLTVFSLPATAPFGTLQEIVGDAPGFWQLTCSGLQSVGFTSGLTTSVPGGFIAAPASTQPRTAIRLVCVEPNTRWLVTSSTGPFVLG